VKCSLRMTGKRMWLVGACLVTGACRVKPPVPTQVAPPPTPALQEEDIRPLEQPQLEIVDLRETPSVDKKRVTLTGTLRNHGTGATHSLLVRVEARDENDDVLLSAEATPSTEEVAPGDTVTFTVTIENRPDVSRYHVETLAQ